MISHGDILDTTFVNSNVVQSSGYHPPLTYLKHFVLNGATNPAYHINLNIINDTLYCAASTTTEVYLINLNDPDGTSYDNLADPNLVNEGINIIKGIPMKSGTDEEPIDYGVIGIADNNTLVLIDSITKSAWSTGENVLTGIGKIKQNQNIRFHGVDSSAGAVLTLEFVCQMTDGSAKRVLLEIPNNFTTTELASIKIADIYQDDVNYPGHLHYNESIFYAMLPVENSVSYTYQTAYNDEPQTQYFQFSDRGVPIVLSGNYIVFEDALYKLNLRVSHDTGELLGSIDRVLQRKFNINDINFHNSPYPGRFFTVATDTGAIVYEIGNEGSSVTNYQILNPLDSNERLVASCDTSMFYDVTSEDPQYYITSSATSNHIYVYKINDPVVNTAD